MRREYTVGENMSALICVLSKAILNKEVEIKMGDDVERGVITKIDGRYIGDRSIMYLRFENSDSPLPTMLTITSGDRVAFDLDRAELYYDGVVGEVVRIDSVKNNDVVDK